MLDPMPEGSPLSTELAFFEEKRDEWLRVYLNKYVVVKGRELLGSFDTLEAAFNAGMVAYGMPPFLVKQVLPEDPVVRVPALTLGLLSTSS